jgi:hypothetical protein
MSREQVGNTVSCQPGVHADRETYIMSSFTMGLPPNDPDSVDVWVFEEGELRVSYDENGSAQKACLEDVNVYHLTFFGRIRDFLGL